MNPEEVLHLFEAITNPRWLSWPLIGRNTFDHISGELITKKKVSNTDPIKKPGVNTGARDG
jgi:hypothetical protein